MSPDILIEFCSAVGNLTAASDDHLIKRLGVSPRALYAGPSHVGACKVEFFDDGDYCPSQAGAPAIIVPVGRHYRDCVGWSDIIDLVAFRAVTPQAWGSRLGVGVVLGLDAIESAEHFRADIVVWSTPLRWLQAGCEGACVIRWDASAVALHLRGLHESGCLIADTDHLAARLDDALSGPRRRPVIRVIDEVSHAA